MKNFCLQGEFLQDEVRAIGDMASLCGYQLTQIADLNLTHAALNVPAVAGELRSEYIRKLKIATLDFFTKLSGEKVRTPWGILTGVRPGKLVYSLLDRGIALENIPQYLETNYLVPQKQGRLLQEIVGRQMEILPTAERFRDAGIYLGVPFCPSRCSYCSFPAGIVPADEESQQNFVNLIEQDMLNVVQLLGMHDLHVKSLYIGGGTPTSLNNKVFARLMQIVSKHLGNLAPQEFTVEAGRADCFTAEKLKAMEAVGANRISVNPQTFHDRTLELIGRRHTVAQFYEAYELVRKSAIPIVNMDLIVGLPGESEAEIAESFSRALELAPDNLTIHTLTLKKSAPLFGSQLELPAEAGERLVSLGEKMARGAGLVPYYMYRQHYMLGHLANIGYARPGTESIYNIQMMEERHPVVGIGPASASKNPLADGHHLAKLNMPKNVAVYAKDLEALGRKRAALFEEPLK